MVNKVAAKYNNIEFFRNKKVLVTGHTGFIGSWLTKWLTMLNSKICGYSLEPPSIPNLYESLDMEHQIMDIRGDIRDRDLLKNTIQEFRPQIVFHLAAQPIVLDSYDNPVNTFDSNVTGTVNLLNELREVDSVKTIIVMTSDKSYRNNEWVYPYRENDILGGKDPYSASKSCQDIVVNSFRDSYFSNLGVGISSVRAGNVIGGGDWAAHRIIPDLVRGIIQGEAVKIRNPQSFRPWQHVMEPIFGVLTLAERMYSDINLSGAWNFGPNNYQEVNVITLVEKFIKFWGKGKYKIEQNESRQESNFLSLDISKVKKEIGWYPKYNLNTAINKTVQWYKGYYEFNEAVKLTENQITEYMNAKF